MAEDATRIYSQVHLRVVRVGIAPLYYWCPLHAVTKATDLKKLLVKWVGGVRHLRTGATKIKYKKAGGEQFAEKGNRKGELQHSSLGLQNMNTLYSQLDTSNLTSIICTVSHCQHRISFWNINQRFEPRSCTFRNKGNSGLWSVVGLI